jgi:dienelactone hydrolase
LLVYSISGEPLKAIDMENARTGGLYWAGEDRLVLVAGVTARPAGMSAPTTSTHAFVLNLISGKMFPLFQPGKDSGSVFRQYAYFGAVEVNGRWTGYFSGFGAHGYQLLRVDLDTGQRDAVKTPAPFGNQARRVDWTIGANGEIAARADYEVEHGIWKVYASGSGSDSRAAAERLVAENDHDPYDTASLKGLGRTAGTIAYAAPDGQQSMHAYEASASGDPAPIELAPGLRLVTFIHDPVTWLLLGAAVDSPVPRYVWFDPDRDRRFQTVQNALAGREPVLISWSAGLNRLVVLTEGDRDPGTYWLVDLTKGRADILGDEWTSITPDDVNPVQAIRYATDDGLQIEAVLTLPRNKPPKGLPLVVIPHGSLGSDRPRFDWLAQAFASMGYAVLQPNYRGSSGYGDAFRQAIYGEMGRKVLTDVSSGVTALAAKGVIDPNRVCIMGADLGGFIALAGVTLQHHLYRCAVSVKGISSLADYVPSEDEDGPAARSLRRLFGMKDRSQIAEGSRGVSPAASAKRADAPILLIDDKADTLAPLSQSEKMKHALEAAEKPVEMVVLDGDDPGFAFAETRAAMLKAAAAFIQKYNPPN